MDTIRQQKTSALIKKELATIFLNDGPYVSKPDWKSPGPVEEQLMSMFFVPVPGNI